MSKRKVPFKQEHPLGELLLALSLLLCRLRSLLAQFRPAASFLMACLPSALWLVVAEKRKAEAARIREKYPDRIPVSSWPSMPTLPFSHSFPASPHMP